MSTPEPQPKAPLRILVVDDDVLIQMATSDMVLDLGHEPLEASSGQEALEILRSGNRIDLLITDQAMPGMTGIELVRTIRGFMPDLPVLLATGYGELPETPEFEIARLNKPFRLEELAQRLEALARSRG